MSIKRNLESGKIRCQRCGHSKVWKNGIYAWLQERYYMKQYVEGFRRSGMLNFLAFIKQYNWIYRANAAAQHESILLYRPVPMTCTATSSLTK